MPSDPTAPWATSRPRSSSSSPLTGQLPRSSHPEWRKVGEQVGRGHAKGTSSYIYLPLLHFFSFFSLPLLSLLPIYLLLFEEREEEKSVRWISPLRDPPHSSSLFADPILKKFFTYTTPAFEVCRPPAAHAQPCVHLRPGKLLT